MESPKESSARLCRAMLIDRFVWGAVGKNSPHDVVPFDDLATLALPLCEIEYAGESHYLMRVDPLPNGRQVYYTACGGELPERPAPTNEPICPQCRRAVEKMGYELPY